MSHFAFYAEPTPVPTRHGDVYVGIGQSDDGLESVSIVGPGDESTDIHMSAQQAAELGAELLRSASASQRHTMFSEEPAR